jgi:hypothetical protein
VRPSDLTFVGEETLPQWAATFARQLGDGGAGAPLDVLSPVPLLEELLSIIDGMTRGHEAPTPADRRSLRDDLVLACERFGPATANLHATTLKGFRVQAGRLDKALETVSGAVGLTPAVNVLLTELAAPESRVAAFDDCVGAFEGLSSVDMCELRIRQLRSFVVRAGHDWEERGKLLLDALADRVSAQLAGGVEQPETADPWEMQAGMTLDERLDLARALLIQEPRTAGVVVWLAYANASVDPVHLKRGPVEFYDSRIWTAAVEGEWPGNRDWTQPGELADHEATMHLDGLPETDFVMVRIALTNASVTQADGRARELADAALALTGWESKWLPLRGAAKYTTHWFGSLGFLDPRLLPPASNPLFDPVTSELGGVDEDLLARLATGEQAARELLDDVRWRRDALAALSRDHRVALAVTLVERILPTTSPDGGRGWHAATAYYLKTLLALDDLTQLVRDAGDTAIYPRLSARIQTSVANAHEIVESRGRNSYVVRLERVVGRIDELIAVADPATMEGRMLIEIKTRLTDGPSARAWLAECETRFDRLLARARRQRNAITHGTRTVAEVVSSIEPFLDRATGRLVGALQQSVEEGTHLPTLLAGYRTTWERRKAALATGTDPVSQLF